MARERRVYSAAERKELWERWKRGETVSDIARALDRAPRDDSLHPAPARRCRPDRHGGRSRYRAAEADKRAWANARAASDLQARP